MESSSAWVTGEEQAGGPEQACQVLGGDSCPAAGS